MTKRLAILAAGLVTAAGAQQHAAPAPAFAEPNLTPKGVAAMASACAMCHGDRGIPVAGSNVARLAGRRADDTAAAMKAFRDGKREATIMHQISKGYTDAEIAALAAYFAAQKEGS